MASSNNRNKKNQRNAPPALILVDKPLGISSQSCLNRVKKSLNIRKVGHCGTLDPAATGLLICLTGSATRLASLIEKQSKVYTGLIRFGQSTTSYDLEGEVVSQSAERPELESLQQVINQKFTGKIQQMPPKYSALKVNGKRAYDLARKAIDFELKQREVDIEYFRIEQVNAEDFSFEIKCSVGTYIRSIANDLGAEVNIPSCLAALRRTQIGEYRVDLAKDPLDLTESDLQDWSIIFPDAFRFQPDQPTLKMLLNGDPRSFDRLPEKSQTNQMIYENAGQALGLLAFRDNNWVFDFQGYGPEVIDK